MSFLKIIFPEPLHDYTGILTGVVIFQWDGASRHYATIIRDNPDTRFLGRRIGHEGAHLLLPARSPDLTPLNFFRRLFKTKVYRRIKRDLTYN